MRIRLKSFNPFRIGLCVTFLFCVAGIHAQARLSLSREGEALSFACSWEEKTKGIGFDGKRIDWKQRGWSGVAGMGALGGWRALRTNPYFSLLEDPAGSPWVDSARFLVVGVKSKNLGFVTATEREEDAQGLGRLGYFGFECAIAEVRARAFALESSLGIALTATKQNAGSSGWSTRLPSLGYGNLFHLGGHANLAFGAWKSSLWLSGYKPQFGYFSFASTIGFGVSKKMSAGKAYDIRASAFLCGVDYRNILGEVPAFDRVLELESELLFGDWRVEAGLRSISRGMAGDSLENILLLNPDVPSLQRFGWIWKTDAINGKLSVLWTSDFFKPSMQVKVSFDARGFAGAAVDAALVLGRALPWSTQPRASLSASLSRSNVTGEEEWDEELFTEDGTSMLWAPPVFRAAKASISFSWPGSGSAKTKPANGIALSRGAVEVSLRLRAGEDSRQAGTLSTSFSLRQTISVSRRAKLEFTVTSPEDGYMILPWGSKVPLAIPDFRLALDIDQWL